MFTTINLLNSVVTARRVIIFDNETGVKLYQRVSSFKIEHNTNEIDIFVSECISNQVIKNLEYADIIIEIDGSLYEYID